MIIYTESKKIILDSVTLASIVNKHQSQSNFILTAKTELDSHNRSRQICWLG